MKILTWHVHGSYLYYLVMAGMVPGHEHQFYLPVKPGKPEGAPRPEGYGGRAGDFPWPDNMHDVPAEEVRNQQFDVILYQSRKNWEVDQYEILSDEQRDLPRVYLEHDPPRHAPQDAPTNTKHIVDDPNVLLVHCTHFNNLMWDNNRTPSRVIEHGVIVPDELRWTGELERGIVVVNGLKKRGRRLGYDIWQRASEELPLDLAGMESAEIGGMGPVPLTELWQMETRYRFFFNPIRYTSLGLAVLEAMMVGLPIVGLATTEMVSAVRNGVNGYVETNVTALIEHMQRLLKDHSEAAELSRGARHIARERFGIERFARDWDETFRFVAGSRPQRALVNDEKPGFSEKPGFLAPSAAQMEVQL
jgi:hypothetical protein